MYPHVYHKAEEIWTRISNSTQAKAFTFDLDVYKKLLNLFMAGDYYYYIFNVTTAAFEYLSDEITSITGYEKEAIDVAFFLDKIHPEDQPWFLAFENKVTEFFHTLTPQQIPHYKVRYDYRIRQKNGNYIRILQQVITIQSEQGSVQRCLGIHTDISHLKASGQPVLSFIGLNGEPSYIDVKVQEKTMAALFPLTKREVEILHLLADGKSSDEIGLQLYISKQTVNTHRKNLLQKTGCVNATEMVAMAIRKGWL